MTDSKPATTAAEMKGFSDAKMAKGPSDAKAPFIWAAGEPGRTTLFPLRYPELYERRKVLERLRWPVEDVDTTKDAADWLTLTEPERHAIRYPLGLFAVFDTLVLTHIPELSKEIDCMEAQRVYAAQADQEAVHEEAYMLQIEAIARDEKEKHFMLDSIKNMPGVAALVAWATDRMSAKRPIADRIIAMAAIEGGVFSAMFSIVQWLRERKVLNGVATFNEFIVRDEGCHALFSCLLIHDYVRHKPAASVAAEIMTSAVACVSTMIDEALPQPLVGINASQVKKYTKFQVDAALTAMGYPAIYGVKNPLKFMDKLSLNIVGKSNFFERRVTQYQGATQGATVYRLNTDPIHS